MAPRDESNGSNPSRDQQNDMNNPDQNPFVHFRRSVDNMAASIFADLAEMFPSLQKHVPPPGTSFVDTLNREVFGKFNDSYERATNPERKRIERYTREENNDTPRNQPRSRWWWCSGGRIVEPDPLGKDEQFDAAKPSTPETMPSPFEIVLFGHYQITPPWRPTLEYLLQSDYSPISLERDSNLNKADDRWRLAFEDLLRIDHNKPMTHRPKAWKPQPIPAVSYVYIHALGQRGFVENLGAYPFLLKAFGMPDLSPSQLIGFRMMHPTFDEPFAAADQTFFNLPERASKQQEESARDQAFKLAASTWGYADTELDLYKRYILDGDESVSPENVFQKKYGITDVEEGQEKDDDDNNDAEDAPAPPSETQYFSSTSTSSYTTRSSSAEPAEAEQHGLGILSSLTTTERRVLPDGSILTHTTLKKKFADGREETDESTEVKPPVREAPQLVQSSRRQPRIADAASEKPWQMQNQTQERKDEERGGWFWSSR